MKRFFLFRARMLLELFGLSAFVYGFFTHRPLLTDIGGGILVATDIFFMLAGALQPGFPIVAAIIGALLIDPWRYGVYWASAVFAFFSVPFYLLWLFRPPIAPDGYPRGQSVATSGNAASQRVLPKSIAHFSLVDPPARSRNWVTPIVAVVVVLLVIIVGVQAAIEWQNLGASTGPQTGPPSASVTPTADVTRVPTPQPSAPSNEPATWVHGTFANDTVEFDYPNDSLVRIDRPGYVKVTTPTSEFVLTWAENITGHDFGNVIATRDTDPDFGKHYREYVLRQLSGEFESQGSTISASSDANVRPIGKYHVVVIDLVIEVPLLMGGTGPVRMLFIQFDCAQFGCQLEFARPGAEPFNPTQWGQVEHIVSSIAFVD